MILAAGLLVLLGLGLFIGGVVTGTTTLYWACVAACGLAAVVLVVARLRMAREARGFDRRASEAPSRAGTRAATPPTGTRPPEAPAGPGTAPQPVVSAEPAPAADPPATREPLAVPEPEAAPRPAGATAVRMPEPEPWPAPPTEEPSAVVPPSAPAANGHPEAPARRGAHEPRESPTDATTGEPGEEDVEVTDLLLVVDLDDEVLVVDEHPRYHLAGCPSLDGREGIPLPMVEARTDGFTPCVTCRPVRHLADTERSRRRAARGN
ncbi:hypothetical protein [Geodermatophilus sp. SYSU D01176]